MTRLIRLKELVPDYYADIYDMDLIVSVEQPLLDDLQLLIERNRDNHFAILADSQGLSIFEDMLGIEDVVGQDLETRRYNVIMQLLPPKPINMAYMRELLEALKINADLIVDGPKFHVTVKTRTDDNSAMKRLNVLLKRFLPVNLTFTTFNFQQTSTVGVANVGTDQLISATISNKGGE